MTKSRPFQSLYSHKGRRDNNTTPFLLISLISYLHLLVNYSDFLFNIYSSLKFFKSQNFSIKQSLQTPPLRVPSTIKIIFHFVLAIVFSSFNFHMYLKSSVMLTYILWQKSLVWFLKRSLNELFAIPKCFLSSLLDADTAALYTMFAVKHLLSSGHSALFQQLHPWLLQVG